jgi:hypothetical protein
VSPVRYGLYLCVPYGSHSKQRLFPHSINRLGSVVEMQRVSCEVRSQSSRIVRKNIKLQTLKHGSGAHISVTIFNTIFTVDGKI